MQNLNKSINIVSLMTRRMFMRSVAAASVTFAAKGFAAETFASGDNRLITLSDGSFNFPPTLWIGGWA